MKGVMLVLGGLCWFLFALGFGCFLVKYLIGGAGEQLFGFGIFPGSILIGMVHVVGLFMAVVLCFVIGVGLCVHGLVPPEQVTEFASRPKPQSPLKFVSRPLDRSRSNAPGSCSACVRCESPLGDCIHICPQCGWTQPCATTHESPPCVGQLKNCPLRRVEAV